MEFNVQHQVGEGLVQGDHRADLEPGWDKDGNFPKLICTPKGC